MEPQEWKDVNLVEVNRKERSDLRPKVSAQNTA